MVINIAEAGFLKAYVSTPCVCDSPCNNFFNPLAKARWFSSCKVCENRQLWKDLPLDRMLWCWISSATVRHWRPQTTENTFLEHVRNTPHLSRPKAICAWQTNPCILCPCPQDSLIIEQHLEESERTHHNLGLNVPYPATILKER